MSKPMFGSVSNVLMLYWCDWHSTWLLFGIVACLLVGFVRRRGVIGDFRLPPGCCGLPVIGETIAFLNDGRKFVKDRRCRYGPVFRTHLLGCPTVIAVGAANVRRVLLADEATLVQTAPGNFLRLIGPGALTTSSSHADHLRLRKVIARALTSRDYLPAICSAVQRIIRTELTSWSSDRHLVKRSDDFMVSETIQVVRCVDRCRRMMTDICSVLFLGLDERSDDATRVACNFDEFSQAVFALPINLPGFSFYRGLKARSQLLSIIDEAARRQKDEKNPFQLLTAIIDASMNGINVAGCKLSSTTDSSELVGSLVLEMLFGAHDPTLSAMCTIIIRLCEQKIVLQHIRDELTSVTGNDDPAEFLSYDVIRSMSYVSDVVSEVLRVQPPVAGAFRKTMTSFEIGGYTVPPGWLVMYSITDTHDSAHPSEDPLTFDPSRWQRRRHAAVNASPSSSPALALTPTPECALCKNNVSSSCCCNSRSVDSSHRFEYVAFGGGSRRSCVGQVLARLFLAVFVVELTRVAPEGWTLVNGVPALQTAPVPIPIDGLPIRLR